MFCALNSLKSEALLTVDQLAFRLSCSKDHVVRLVDDGTIPFLDIARAGGTNRKIRFRNDAVEAFLGRQQRCVPTNTAERTKPKAAQPSSAIAAKYLIRLRNEPV